MGSKPADTTESLSKQERIDFEQDLVSNDLELDPTTTILLVSPLMLRSQTLTYRTGTARMQTARAKRLLLIIFTRFS